VRKSGFSMEAQGQNAAGDAHGGLRGFERRGVGIGVLLDQLRRGCGPIESVWIGFVAARLNLGELFLALKKLVNWLKG